ncbi:dihydrofolate reductase [Paracoccus spongiarum]|uniref:Dihydrofolate reductase n=1 Tax=Paracoccus spongiarum TaxID=3064387 RepID=A0ABT9JBC8_9RHOB|nr:dihydrofolate reductase [Paracoccus sp. 2205BS29-5]MDP5307120.1 dihydrofolate reductase [Paracoccus sp. 2205BS29-5]
MLTLIAARDRAGAIGRGNTIPWHVPEDFAFFKRETMGGAILMGRRTWDSLPRRPLPGRLNIVISRDTAPREGAVVVSSPDQALAAAQGAGHDHAFCIGGAQIYAQMLPRADRVLLSVVDLRVEDADAFFPRLDPAEWQPVGSQVLRSAAPSCHVEEYRRIAEGPAPAG